MSERKSVKLQREEMPGHKANAAIAAIEPTPCHGTRSLARSYGCVGVVRRVPWYPITAVP